MATELLATASTAAPTDGVNVLGGAVLNHSVVSKIVAALG